MDRIHVPNPFTEPCTVYRDPTDPQHVPLCKHHLSPGVLHTSTMYRTRVLVLSTAYREQCFIRYQNTAKWVKVFFNPLQGVWVPDETLFQVFDIASQTDR